MKVKRTFGAQIEADHEAAKLGRIISALMEKFGTTRQETIGNIFVFGMERAEKLAKGEQSEQPGDNKD